MEELTCELGKLFLKLFWSCGHIYSRSCVYASSKWTCCFSYLRSGIWACLSCTVLTLTIINSLHISPCIVVTWHVLKVESAHSFYYADTFENICFNIWSANICLQRNPVPWKGIIKHILVHWVNFYYLESEIDLFAVLFAADCFFSDDTQDG